MPPKTNTPAPAKKKHVAPPKPKKAVQPPPKKINHVKKSDARSTTAQHLREGHPWMFKPVHHKDGTVTKAMSDKQAVKQYSDYENGDHDLPWCTGCKWTARHNKR